MENQGFITSTTLSTRKVGQYGTPIFNRDELHRTVSPILSSSDFNSPKYMCDIAEDIMNDFIFEQILRL